MAEENQRVSEQAFAHSNEIIRQTTRRPERYDD